MQGKTIKPLRLSASIILSLGDAEQDANRFLMLVRKPHMSFENSLVFPGGACDKEDETFSTHFPDFAKITAVRELMEETGILLLPPGSEVQNLSGLRIQYSNRKLDDLNSLLLSLWEKHLHLLLPVARFLTPHFPRMSRFDCLFFLVLPGVQRVNLGASDSLMELSIHIEESSKYYWATAQDYLQMMLDGLIFLPPPQRLLLHYLAAVGRQAYQIQPVVDPLLGQFGKGKYFVLPGDEEYDYEKFAELEPKSRLSEEIRAYIEKKKENCKINHLCRAGNIFPAKKKEAIQPLQILLYPQQQTTILSYIPTSSTVKSKL